ncbi:MAG: hypothetical protein R3F37_19410 [Candidatus Competibacteraceae bacterium]
MADDWQDCRKGIDQSSLQDEVLKVFGFVEDGEDRSIFAGSGVFASVHHFVPSCGLRSVCFQWLASGVQGNTGHNEPFYLML